jgi:hypothetical protein
LITYLQTSLLPGEAADSQCGRGPLSDLDVGSHPSPFSFHVTGFTGSMMNEVGSMRDRKLGLLIDPFNMFSYEE